MKKEIFNHVGRRQFLKSSVALGALSAIPSPALAYPVISQANDREYWVQVLNRISGPVLKSLSERKLKAEMPVEAPHGNTADRRQFTYLEAMGRLLTGIAPWLESGPLSGSEGDLRSQHAEWSRMAIAAGTEPASPDFMNFNQGQRPVVDTAFLALAILRAPTELWKKLDAATQHNVIAALESSRVIQPAYSNWFLFSAIVKRHYPSWVCGGIPCAWTTRSAPLTPGTKETAFTAMGRLSIGITDSFVMHPMLLQILDTVSKSSTAWDSYKPLAMLRARRYAAIQERLISPEGTFPPIGRSLCYRFGAFHLLAEMSLRQQLLRGFFLDRFAPLTAVATHDRSARHV